jgi:SAM-dependent methyltransferase
MVADALGTAMLDYQRGELGDCRYVDGDETHDAYIYENYFVPREEWSEETVSRLESLDGAVLDVGCGSGQHARWFQDHGVDVVAIDLSPGAVEAARERGVEDARVMDMVDLDFERDRFRSVLVNGTQIGLFHSVAGARSFLADLARVTDPEGVAVVDNYDPARLDDDDELFGYRPDPRAGVAHRTFHFEYDRHGERLVGRTLHFLLFSPDRLRDICVGTPWSVVNVDYRDVYYKARLEK